MSQQPGGRSPSKPSGKSPAKSQQHGRAYSPAAERGLSAAGGQSSRAQSTNRSPGRPCGYDKDGRSPSTQRNSAAGLSSGSPNKRGQSESQDFASLSKNIKGLAIDPSQKFEQSSGSSSVPGSPHQLLQTTIHLPPRPDTRRKGSKVELGANRLVLDLPLGKCCSFYRLCLTAKTPEATNMSIQSVRVMREGFAELTKLLREQLGTDLVLVSDYRVLVMAFQTLPTAKEYKVVLPSGPVLHYKLARLEADEFYQLRRQILSSAKSTAITSHEFANMLAAITVDDFRRHLSLRALCSLVSSEEPSITSKSLIPLVAFRGMPISIRPSGRLLANLECTDQFHDWMVLHKLLGRVGSVLGFGSDFEMFFDGVKVKEMFGKHKTRKIRRFLLKDNSSGIAASLDDFHGASSFSFDVNGARRTVKQHFTEVYDQNVSKHVLDQTPLVDVGWWSRKQNKDIKIMIPTTLLEVMPCNLFVSKLSKLERSQVYEIAKTSLQTNGIGTIPRLIGSKNGAQMRFGLHSISPFNLVPHKIQVPGRSLERQEIIYSGGSKNPSISTGTWDLKDLSFARGASIDKLTILHIQWANMTSKSVLLPGGIDKFMTSLRMSGLKGRALNEDVKPSQLGLSLRKADPKPWTRDIQSMLQGINATPGNFTLIVLPEDPGQLHDRVKRICDVQFGLAHTCTTPMGLTPQTGWRQLATIAHKINLKAGGFNINSTKSLPKDTMVIGIQTSQLTSPHLKAMPTAAVVVTSTGPRSTRYAANVTIQAGQTIPAAALSRIITHRALAWQKSTGTPPAHILLYRTGLSTSQYALALAEAATIKSALPSSPSLTLIATSRPTHTRLTSPHPIPPAVIDTALTAARTFDFYLHPGDAGKKRSVRPTHYTVLADERGYGAEEVQDLTHAMCHEGGRDTRAVGVPGVSYWAGVGVGRVKGLVRDLVEGWVEENLNLGKGKEEKGGDVDVGDGEVEGKSKREVRREVEGRKRAYESLPEKYRWNGLVHENLRDGMWFV